MDLSKIDMDLKSYNQNQLKKFGIFSFLLIGFLSYPLIIHSKFLLLIFLLIELNILSIVLFKPYKIQYALNLSIRISNYIGSINSNLLFTFFFFTVITPISLFLRLNQIIFINSRQNFSFYEKPIKETSFNEEF